MIVRRSALSTSADEQQDWWWCPRQPPDSRLSQTSDATKLSSCTPLASGNKDIKNTTVLIRNKQKDTIRTEISSKYFFSPINLSLTRVSHGLTFQRQSQKVNYFSLFAWNQKNLAAAVEKDFEIIQCSQIAVQEQYQNYSRIGWEKPKMLFIFFLLQNVLLAFRLFFVWHWTLEGGRRGGGINKDTLFSLFYIRRWRWQYFVCLGYRLARSLYRNVKIGGP